jgi:hypothetical protein
MRGTGRLTGRASISMASDFGFQRSPDFARLPFRNRAKSGDTGR